MTRLPVADRPAVRRALAGLVGTQRQAVTLVLVLHAAAAVAGLAAPWLLGRIVDAVTHGQGTGVVDGYALGIVGSVAAQGLLSRYAQYAGHRLSERAIATLREDFVDRTLRLPVGVVERAGMGDLATLSSVDVSTVGTTVRDVLPIMAVASAQLLLLFGAIFLLSPWLGLVALTGLPSISLVARWYLRRAGGAYLTEGAATAELTDTLTTTAEGTRTIEALSLGPERVRTGTDRVARVWQARMATLRLRSVLFPIVEASYAVPIAVVLLTGGLLLDHGMATLGAVVAAALYLQQAIEPLDRVLQWMEQAQRGLASFARVLGVGLVPPERGGAAGHPDGIRIEARGVRFAYPGHHDVLHGVDLDVRPGERLAVVGPSGAGKSTLARVLAGLEVPRAGTVTIGGVPVTGLDPARRHREIALLTQEHHVFLGSLRDNLAFAAPDTTDDDMRAALRTVGADWYDDLPDGLATALGDGVRELSAADAQQIALARLVLGDPHTLILDEATAALDPSTARRTERALAVILTGRTVIAIAHRPNTAHDADRVAVMEAAGWSNWAATTTCWPPAARTRSSGAPGTANHPTGLPARGRFGMHRRHASKSHGDRPRSSALICRDPCGSCFSSSRTTAGTWGCGSTCSGCIVHGPPQDRVSAAPKRGLTTTPRHGGTVGVLYDYFRAADGATVAKLMEATDGGPLVQHGPEPVADAVDAKGIDPTVVLGKLVSFALDPETSRV